MYTQEEAFAETLKYFNGDELATSVFISKYALRDLAGQLLEKTPTDMHHRLAKEFARIESKYPNPISEEDIFGYLSRWELVPQGSPMSAVGNPYKVQSLSNCFVIDSPADSYGGILFADQEQAQIMKRRGGVGFDISTIRPKGLATANAAGTTDGIGVFMERFSNTCREVAQGGRRGALMLTISIKYPSIEEFINIKRDLKKITGANISIRLTDDFMKAVKDDADFNLQWPVDVPLEQAIVVKKVRAKDIWNQINDAAWTSAEPGLLFWDTVTKNTPTEAYKSLGYGNVSTNPCSEITLSPYDSCRLLVVNLLKFVKDAYTPAATFDYVSFVTASQVAQRLMDDLVDLELEAVDKIIAKIENDSEPAHVKLTELSLWQKIKIAASGGRRTGLGITALGDTLAALNIRYGSEDSVSRTEEIYKVLTVNAYRSSVKMANERGAFPVYSYDLENDHPFLQRIMAIDPALEADYIKYGRRNIALTTTAPGGSISCLTQTTSGIEPAFLVSYTRRKKITATDVDSHVDFIDDLGDKWQEYKIYHHGYKAWMDASGKGDNVELSPYWKATSNDIDWDMSVKLQAAAQRYICHAISKTCNLPSNATKETVSSVYMSAWESGCKGFTVYRDGCRSGVLISNETKNELAKPIVDDQPTTIVENHAPKRPKELPCDIHRINVRGSEGAEHYLVLIGKFQGVPYEVFCGLSSHVEVPKKAKLGRLVKNGKKDGLSIYNLHIPVATDDEIIFKNVVDLFDNPTYGSFTRSLSLSLRHGIPIQYLVEQLQKDKHSDMQSFSRVISRVLKGYIPNGTKSASDKICHSCGAESLIYTEGCVTCAACGWSKC
jgi:ribonucleoside-diphosphate reductase alpha chain